MFNCEPSKKLLEAGIKEFYAEANEEDLCDAVGNELSKQWLDIYPGGAVKHWALKVNKELHIYTYTVKLIKDITTNPVETVQGMVICKLGFNAAKSSSPFSNFCRAFAQVCSRIF